MLTQTIDNVPVWVVALGGALNFQLGRWYQRWMTRKVER